MTPLRVVLSIDVEEEGLFGGAYARSDVSVRNVGWLEQLVPLLQRTQLPVTLLCAHSVFTDVVACRALDAVRRACRVEIGAHLHHWNTPPLSLPPADGGAYESAGSVPEELMREKLHTLFCAGKAFAGHSLTSFRMGRWDMHRAHWPLLAQCGVKVDASVRPLHCGPAGSAAPDHYFAPCTPYWVDAGGAELLEMPLTCVPLIPGGGRVLGGVPAVRHTVQKWGALAVLPVYHPLWAMRAITRCMIAQGVNVLSLTWHSSEMMPGGAPHIPDIAAVRRLLTRIGDYLLWLRRHWDVRGLTLEEMRGEPDTWPRGASGGHVAGGDWRYSRDGKGTLL